METNNVFTSEAYLNIMKKLNEQRRLISQEEMIMIQDWHKALMSYFNNIKTGFVCVNDFLYVKVDNINSGIYDVRHIDDVVNSPVHWFNLQGLVLNRHGSTINSCFKMSIKLTINGNIRECDETEFRQIVNEICEKVFDNTEENFNKQFNNYTSFFFENLLFKYKDYFDDKVIEFVKKLENKFDELDT